jgi:ERCC4-type nuclease
MLYVDNCEVKSKIPEYLKKYTNDFTVQKLEIGDYVYGDTAIERKTTADFLHSIYDGRLWKQAFNMMTNYKKSIFIIEGGFPVVYDQQTFRKRASFLGAVAKLLHKYNASIIVTPDAESSAMIIADGYLTLENKDESKLAPVQKCGKTKTEIIENILCQIPHVGRARAMAILKQYGSIQTVSSLSVEDLQGIEGIGKTRATVIAEFLQADYNKQVKKK